jgi:hypothetical protein
LRRDTRPANTQFNLQNRLRKVRERRLFCYVSCLWLKCLWRLIVARAARPMIIPAMIDTHGKPGIAGNTIGVETVAELDVVVGVLMMVLLLAAEV